MSRRTLFWSVSAVIVFVTTIVLVQIISGGEKTFQRVAETLKAHRYIVEKVGSPIASVAENGGPSEISISSEDRRYGYYSVDVEGPKMKVPLKVYWREQTDGAIEIDAIFGSKPWAQDVLVWGQIRR